MIEIPSNSSALLGFAYDPDRRLLQVRFRTGDLYLYHSVPPEVVEAITLAPSQGQYFNLTIRNQFSFTRLS